MAVHKARLFKKNNVMAVTVTDFFSKVNVIKNSHFADRKMGVSCCGWGQVTCGSNGACYPGVRGSCSGLDLDGCLQEMALCLVWEEWGCPKHTSQSRG